MVVDADIEIGVWPSTAGCVRATQDDGGDVPYLAKIIGNLDQHANFIWRHAARQIPHKMIIAAIVMYTRQTASGGIGWEVSCAAL
jgi:hypothetical protein